MDCFRGLKTICEPPNKNPTDIDIVIVDCIHNRSDKPRAPSSSGVDEWTWLSELLSHSIPHSRVMLYTYSCSIPDGAGSFFPNPIADCAKQLLSGLLHDRRTLASSGRHCPIVFMGHGVGVFVIQKALALSTHDEVYDFITKSSSLIVCFNAIHRANQLTAWSGVISDHISSIECAVCARITYPQLMAYSGTAERATRAFYECRMAYRLINIYQKDVISGVDVITKGKYSSTTDFIYDVNIGRESMWKALCSTTDRDDELSALIVAAIQLEKGQVTREFLSILHSISPGFVVPHDPEIELADILQIRDPRTTYESWIQRKPSFVTFVQSYPSIQSGGVSGYIYRDVRERVSVVAYYLISRQTSATSLIASIIAQILSSSTVSLTRTHELISSIKEKEVFTDRALLALLRLVLNTKAPGTVVIIIDRAQDCQFPMEMIFEKMIETMPNNLKIVLFGLNDTQSKRLVQKYNVPGMNLDLNSLTEKSAHYHVSHTIPSLVHQETSFWELKGEIQEALTKCQTPLQLSLNLHIIGKAATGALANLKSVRAAVMHLPNSTEHVLDTLYAELPQWGKRVLSWIVNAQRPLKATELAVALVLSDKDVRQKVELGNEDIPFDILPGLKSMLGPVVTFNGEFIFIEQDMCEHLRHRMSMDVQCGYILSRLDIVRYLLRYLTSENILGILKKCIQPGFTEMPKDPALGLAVYAAQLWPAHYKEIEAEGNHINELIEILQSCSDLGSLVRVKSIFDNSGPHPISHNKYDPILVASLYGLHETVRQTAKEITKSTRETAISLGSWAGHLKVVECLVEMASMDELDLTEGLKSASITGHHEIAELLLQKLHKTELIAEGILLCQAVELGYDDEVDLFVAKGANVNQNCNGISPLQLAAKNGHTYIIELLLSKRANVNSIAENGYRPILYASKYGHTEIVQRLLGAGPPASVEVSDHQKSTPLHLAAEGGFNQILRAILLHAKDSVWLDSQNSEGKTPLMLASKAGHLESVKVLLEHGTRVDIISNDGHSAIYYATSAHYEDIAEILIRRSDSYNPPNDLQLFFLEASKLGFAKLVSLCLHTFQRFDFASAGLRDDGLTALHHATINGHKNIVSILLDGGIDINQRTEGAHEHQTSLELAAISGKSAIFNLLIDKGADFERRDSQGWTLVFQIVSKSSTDVLDEHVEVLKTLLEAEKAKGISPDTPETKFPGRRALQLASKMGNLKLAQVLLDFGANPSQTSADGHNALHYASAYGYAQIAKIFLETGDIDPHGGDHRECTPMHQAAKGAFMETMYVLYQAEQSTVNSSDLLLRTPLHWAMRNDNAARWLIEHGANVDATDQFLCTPLQLATQVKNIHVVEALLDAGTNLRIFDDEQKSALHYAASGGFLDGARAILEKDVSIINHQDNDQQTALHVAISDNMMEFTKVLLENKYKHHLNLNIRDRNGDTALLLAVKEDTKEAQEIAQHLLRNNADTEIRNNDGDTALSLAIRDEKRIWEILVDSSSGNPAKIDAGGDVYPTALYLAAKEGLSTVVEKLLELGANIDITGGMYNTALTAASSGGFTEVVQLLLNRGANKAISGGILPNALSAAFITDPYNIIGGLYQDRADLEIKDVEGRTPIHLAACLCSWNLFKKFQKDGAELTGKDNQGRTFLHFAAGNGNVEVVRQALELPELESLNIRDKHGWGPLHWACRKHNNREVVEILLGVTTNSQEPTHNGWTLQDIAVFHRNEGLLDILVEFNDRIVSNRTVKPGTRHWHVTCDSCQQKRIYGISWHCKKCEDFDLCFKCYWEVKGTHMDHEFEKRGVGPTEGPCYEDEDGYENEYGNDSS